MSQGAESSVIGSQLLEPVGEETGLPMIKCPECKRAKLFEALSKKHNANFGPVYVKCHRNYPWIPDKCGYYKFQRGYFNDLVQAKKVQMLVEDDEEIQEFQSNPQILVSGSPTSGGAILGSNELGAKVEKLTQAMKFFFLFAVAFVSMGVGYALK